MFISDHQGKFPILKMVDVLEVSRNIYYSWRYKPVSQLEKADMKLTNQIKEVFTNNSETYTVTPEFIKI